MEAERKRVANEQRSIGAAEGEKMTTLDDVERMEFHAADGIDAARTVRQRAARIYRRRDYLCTPRRSRRWQRRCWSKTGGCRWP